MEKEITQPTTTPNEGQPISLADLRARLAGKKGPAYWRGLEELAETPEFGSYLKQEFPNYPENWDLSATRRDFLKLMGSALAMAGLSACSRPVEKILPYAKNPEELVPGKPWLYATAIPFPFGARGVLVASHMGRPVRVEGNPEHPDSLGASDIFSQSAVLSLYDPDRSQAVTHEGQIDSWQHFSAVAGARLDEERATKGAGLRILTGTVLSPTLAAQLQSFLRAFPEAKWHQYDPVNSDQSREASRLAFGRESDWHYRLEQADVILSIDADFFAASFPGHLACTKAFSGRRKPEGRMNRLYALEVSPSLTGAAADHRLSLNQHDLEHFVRAVARKVGLKTASGKELSGSAEKWAEALAKDLLAHRGTSAIVVGPEQSAGVQSIALAMNALLGNLGRTVITTDRLELHPENQGESIVRLAEDLQSGKAKTLFILGANPAFDAPADLGFADILPKVPFTARLGLYEDETSKLCQWHLPEAHPLESWGDALAFDGTVSIIQPLIAPLYGGKTAHEFIASLDQGGTDYSLVQAYWKSRHGANFDAFWNKSVHDGLVAGTGLAARSETLRAGFTPPPAPQEFTGLEIHYRPDPTIYDGRFANSAWLQELPKPLTKITWDNAVFLAPATAAKLELTNGDVVDLKLGGLSVQGPVWVLPGQAENAATVNFGYGRTRAGKIGNRTGFNAYQIRNSAAAWVAYGLEIQKTGKRYKLATTQIHSSMEGRELVRTADLDTFRKNPKFAQLPEPAEDESLYPAKEPAEHAWALNINLNACIGCNACVIACQSENNIPIVGKDQVLRGREMHWIRIDRYYSGPMDSPKTHFQPVSCMHCENAPCEPVCPVEATTHSKEGLNEMTYNRCVGTRYCSNNCPYKVRRYNFYRYADFNTPQMKMLYNPNVTVRERGVMEKCTYCVQRINGARIEAKKEGRPIKEGEIKTACQQACPADAIVFGDLANPESRASKLRESPLRYGLLAELNVRPRTTYLARVTNPNPEITENA